LVYFRGAWCPFCQAYLQELNGEFLAKVRAAGGELIGVTSQSAEGVATLAADQRLDFRIVSEPANALAKAHRVALTPKAETPLAEVPGEYVNGMAQPAVVAFDRDGRELFHWAIDPNTMNLGGASDRPLPADIWPVLEAALSGETKALEGTTKLDPGYLAAHYPKQHAAFEAWVAASQS
ncbi:MAG: redoxin domain-containing protein, partial [Myxococcota bacterium]